MCKEKKRFDRYTWRKEKWDLIIMQYWWGKRTCLTLCLKTAKTTLVHSPYPSNYSLSTVLPHLLLSTYPPIFPFLSLLSLIFPYCDTLTLLFFFHFYHSTSAFLVSVLSNGYAYIYQVSSLYGVKLHIYLISLRKKKIRFNVTL